jgi:hypothetical protein
MGTGITSQPFIKQTYDTCIWLPPPSRQDAPNQRSSHVMSQRCPTRPWFGAQVLHIDSTDFIAQVAQTCYDPVTNTPGKCISVTSLIHCTTPGAINYSPVLTLVHLEQLRSVPVPKRHRRLPCVKNHPRVKDLFEYNL